METRSGLRLHYDLLSTDELVALLVNDTLTDVAKEVLHEVLDARGIDKPTLERLIEEHKRTLAAENQSAYSDIPRTNSKNYFVRHWFGDLSLPVSYWVNGVLGTFVVSLIATAGAASEVNFASKPRAFALVLIGIWIFLVVATVWQLVGIWRSARRHVRRQGSRVWAVLAQVAVVFAWAKLAIILTNNAAPQIAEYGRLLAGIDWAGPYEIRVLRDGTEIEVSGGIAFGLTEDVRSALSRNPHVSLIHLNSHGGRVGEARLLRDLIDAHGLSTYTSRGCYSACTIAYMAGKERLIAHSASLGFHAYTLPGVTGSVVDHEHNIDKRRFRAKGVSEQFLDKAYGTPHSGLWKPTPVELLQAHVVTGYADESAVAFSATSAVGIERELLASPLYAAIHAQEPEMYEKLKEHMQSGIAAGKTMTELRKALFPLLGEVYGRRLPYASDEALQAYLALMLDQMDALYAKEPVLCYQLLFPSADNPIPTHMLRDFHRRESTVMAAVIQSSDLKRSNVETGEKPFQVLYQRLSQKYGTDMNLLSSPYGKGVDKEKLCVITRDLYREISQLPPAEGLPILRYLLKDT